MFYPVDQISPCHCQFNLFKRYAPCFLKHLIFLIMPVKIFHRCVPIVFFFPNNNYYCLRQIIFWGKAGDIYNSVLSPIPLYNILPAVIPAPVFTGINSRRNPDSEDWIPPYQARGRLIRSGMTELCRVIIETLYYDSFSLFSSTEVCTWISRWGKGMTIPF